MTITNNHDDSKNVHRLKQHDLSVNRTSPRYSPQSWDNTRHAVVSSIIMRHLYVGTNG